MIVNQHQLARVEVEECWLHIAVVSEHSDTKIGVHGLLSGDDGTVAFRRNLQRTFAAVAFHVDVERLHVVEVSPSDVNQVFVPLVVVGVATPHLLLVELEADFVELRPALNRFVKVEDFQPVVVVFCVQILHGFLPCGEYAVDAVV